MVRDNITGKEKHILYIGGTPYESNIVYLKNFTESDGSYKFLHKDYIGSILAISDEAGNKLEQRHYDAWGNFTHLQIGSGAIVTDKNIIDQSSLIIDRGYTSHEHFAEVGIIHMNGRLYDPLLRRFLNADENIQDPYNTQNYNKYGYVMNNPLMFSDPNGEFFVFAFVAAWGVNLFWGAVITAAIIGTAVGLAAYSLGVAISGGNWQLGGALKSMFWGGVSGAVTFGIGSAFTPAAGTILTLTDKVASAVAQGLVHGFAQGILSLMQGANFTHGFASGASGSWGASLFGGIAGSFANSAAGTVVSGMVLGGVASELTGGNFWQGALVGGVVAGLNHVMHLGNMELSAVSDDGNGDCLTCPKNATDGQIYRSIIDGSNLQYRNGSWIEVPSNKFFEYNNKTYFAMSPMGGDSPIGPAGTGKGLKLLLSKDAIKSVSSYKDLIIKHQSKLIKYISKPDNYDNLGILKNAPNQLIRNRIIQSRIQHLRHEIKTFHKNMNNILNGK